MTVLGIRKKNCALVTGNDQKKVFFFFFQGTIFSFEGKKKRYILDAVSCGETEQRSGLSVSQACKYKFPENWKSFLFEFSGLYSSRLLYIYVPTSLWSCLCPCTLAKSPEAPIACFPWESIHPLAFQHTAGTWEGSRHLQHGHFHSAVWQEAQA